MIDQDRDFRTRVRRLYTFAIDHQGQNLALGLILVITKEFRGAAFLTQLEPDGIRPGLAGAGPRRPRFGTLAFHGNIKAVRIHGPVLAAQHILGQIQGKAVSVIETEGNLAWQRLGLAQLLDLAHQQMQATVQGLLEARFLASQGFGNQGLGPG